MRLIAENQSVGAAVSYADAKSIGILFTQSDRTKYMAVRSLIKQFKNDGKQVEVLCYLEKGGENYDFLYDYITSSDVGMWGKMQSQAALKFSKLTFDSEFIICRISLLHRRILNCGKLNYFSFLNHNKKSMYIYKIYSCKVIPSQ